MPNESTKAAPVAQVEVRSVYGNLTIYPINEQAKLFAKLTGKKTFSHADLCTIEALGFTVEEVATKKLAA